MTDPRTAATGVGTVESVRLRTVSGELRRAELVVGDDERPTGLLAVRSVVVDGRSLLQKWVPAAMGADAPSAYDVLEAEVRALARIAHVYPGRVPGELPVLRGYNVDVAEPFLLIEPVVAPRASQVLRRLETQTERVRFVSALLGAVWLAKQAGVTHRGITLDTVRWDGTIATLTDFENARLRSAVGAADDVRAVGTVIREVHVGRRPHEGPESDPPHLRQELHGVFADDPKARPTVEELMARYHVPPPAVTTVEPAHAFEEGRARFEQVSDRKRGGPRQVPEPPRPPAPSGAPPEVPAPAPRPPAARSRSWIVPALLVLVLLVLGAVFGLPLLLGAS